MAMRKFRKIEENIKNKKGKPLQPLYFEDFIDETSYEAIEIFMICYNKIVTRPLLSIRRDTVPPYEITIVVKGFFDLIDDPEKLENFIRREYLNRLPENFHDGLKIKVTMDENPITIQITIN